VGGEKKTDFGEEIFMKKCRDTLKERSPNGRGVQKKKKKGGIKANFDIFVKKNQENRSASPGHASSLGGEAGKTLFLVKKTRKKGGLKTMARDF